MVGIRQGFHKGWWFCRWVGVGSEQAWPARRGACTVRTVSAPPPAPGPTSPPPPAPARAENPATLAGAVLAATALAFALQFAGGGLPYFRDIVFTDLPLRLFIQEALREGRLPQWYPYDFLGIPLIGNAEGLLRPATLLYAALPWTWALRAELIGTFAAGLAGAYLLLRRLALDRPAACFGAAVFAACGYALSIQNNLPYFTPLQMSPWALWAALGAFDPAGRWRWSGALLTGIIWGGIALAGDPLLCAFVALFLLALWATVARTAVNLAALAVMAAVALLFAAPALVSSAVLYQDSERRLIWTPALVGWMGSIFTLSPRRLPELLFGGMVLDVDGDAAIKFAFDGRDPWVHSVFFGISAFAFAGYGAWRRSREALVWGAIAALFLWAALGSAGGLYDLLRTVIPPLGSFRWSAKYLAGTGLALALASSYGLDLLLRRAGDDVRRLGVVTACGAAVLLGALWLSTRVAPGLWVPARVQEAGAFAADLRQLWTQGALLTVAIFAMGLLAIAQAARGRSRWAFAVPALAALELLNATPLSPWLLPSSVYQEVPPLCAAVRAHGAGPGRSRVMALVGPPPPLLAPVANAERYTRRALNLMQPDAGGICGVEGAFPPNLSGQAARTTRAVNFLPPEELGRLFNVGFRIIDTTQRRPGPEVLGVHEQFAVERVETLPRAYAAQPLFVRDGKDAWEAVAASRGDLRGWVVVEGEAEPESMAYGEVGHSAVTIERYAPEEVVLRARLERPAAVVLNDAYRQGWSAEVDGEETPILRANYLVRAVLLPEGEHLVRFRFEMPYLKAGLSLSAAVLLLALLVFVRERSRTKARAPAA